MRAHFVRIIDPYREERKAVIRRWLCRNALRLAFAALVIAAFVFFGWLASVHRFNGIDMAILVSGIMYKCL